MPAPSSAEVSGCVRRSKSSDIIIIIIKQENDYSDVRYDKWVALLDEYQWLLLCISDSIWKGEIRRVGPINIQVRFVRLCPNSYLENACETCL